MWPGNPKITKTNPKRVHQPLLPLRRGEKTTTKIQSVMQPTRRTTPHQWFKHHPTSTHQKRRISHTNQPNKKTIGTLSSSHTTHAHPNTPHKTGPVQSSLLNLTHTHTTNQIAVRGSSERNHQRSFSYRHLTTTRLNQTVWRGVVGHADSHKATHTQPTTQIPWLGLVF